jgi:SAM-dependent methyltransferase
LDAPSPFLLAHADAIERASRLGPVVDVACGEGRHAQALAARGIPVVGVDRDAARLRGLSQRARENAWPIRALCADLEASPSPPWAPARCGALIVFRYLHRPLCAALAASLRPGGLLVYETFTTAQRELGQGPRNPAFLLEPGELPRLFAALEVLESWEGIRPEPRAAVARLVARARARST